MNTRGKFQLINDSKNCWNPTTRIYKFQAVCNDGTPENERFHKYTPSGSIEIAVDNPNVILELGKFYYVDFTEV